jgi:hypothetical protein
MHIPEAKDREDAVQQIDLVIYSVLYGQECPFVPEDLENLIHVMDDFVGQLGIHHALDAEHKERDKKDNELTKEIEAALPSKELKGKLIKLRDDVLGVETAIEGQIKFLAGLMIGLRVAEAVGKKSNDAIDLVIDQLKAGEVSSLLP